MLGRLGPLEMESVMGWFLYCCSVAKWGPTLCDPVDCNMPGSPVLHCLLEFAQIHVHWVADAISSSITLFSFCLLASPASGSFPVTWLFTSGGQSIGVSASASVLPMNIQGWFPLRWTGFISLQSKGLSRLFSSTTIKKYQFFCAQSSSPTSIHDYWETMSLTIWTFVSKVMSLLFNTLSKFVVASLPRSKHLLISWLQSLSTVIWSSRKQNLSLLPLFPLIFAMKWSDWLTWSLLFQCWVSSQHPPQIHTLKSSSPGHQNGTLSGDGVSKKQ